MPVPALNAGTGMPPELAALAEYSGVEFYRVEGATDHGLGIGSASLWQKHINDLINMFLPETESAKHSPAGGDSVPGRSA